MGHWEKPAAEQTIRSIAETLLQLKLCDIDSTPVTPGGEENKWELSVKDGDIVIATGGDPDIMMKLSQLDVQLRHIAKKPGRKICPFQLQIDLLAQRNHFLRATYSHYGNTSSNPNLPLVRGRVFTNELKLK